MMELIAFYWSMPGENWLPELYHLIEHMLFPGIRLELTPENDQ